ncbi:phosphatases II, partial [Trichocladium antarcticum]
NINMTITPSPAAIHHARTRSRSHLTPADLAAITRGGAPQSASDPTHTWRYESRRDAQPVLEYLYLGPTSVVRDRAFLARAGITMVLVARDARFAGVAARLTAGLRRAVDGLGVEVEAVDVADARALVAVFATAGGVVNGHLLGKERQGARGRVLVCCETGNDRSAAIVAAYLMAMFGLDTVRAVQFMLLQRFCVTMGDDTKFALQAYGDILRARGDVAAGDQGLQGGGGRNGAGVAGSRTKRRIEETSGDAGEDQTDGMMGAMDADRYVGRSFAPFIE